jgi:hypothetical protein
MRSLQLHSSGSSAQSRFVLSGLELVDHYWRIEEKKGEVEEFVDEGGQSILENKRKSTHERNQTRKHEESEGKRRKKNQKKNS